MKLNKIFIFFLAIFLISFTFVIAVTSPVNYENNATFSTGNYTENITFNNQYEINNSIMELNLFDAVSEVQATMNISELNMTDGCNGDISFAPDGTYDLQVCLNNGSTVAGSCKTYTSGEYGNGDILNTTATIVADGSYRMSVTWKRIKDPSARYDHGGTTTSTVDNLCIANNYLSGGFYHCDLSDADCIAVGHPTTLFAYDPSSSESGCTISSPFPSVSPFPLFMGETCGGAQFGTSPMYFKTPNNTAVRTYEGGSISGRTSASVGGCSQKNIESWGWGTTIGVDCFDVPSDPTWYGSSCTAGSAGTGGANLCTNAGTNTEYTSYFTINNSRTQVTTNFTEGKANLEANITYAKATDNIIVEIGKNKEFKIYEGIPTPASISDFSANLWSLVDDCSGGFLTGYNCKVPFSFYSANSSRVLNFVLNTTTEENTVAPNIQFESTTTATGNYSQNFILANITASDEGLDTITVFLYNSTDLVQSNTSSSNFSITFSNLPSGTYYLNATANDTSSNENQTETRQINLSDTEPPIITVINPISGVDENFPPISFIVSLNEEGTCDYSLDNSSNVSMTTTDNLLFINSLFVSAGSHNVIFHCNDSIGNNASSNLIYFDYHILGGGGSTSTTTPEENETIIVSDVIVKKTKTEIIKEGVQSITTSISENKEAYIWSAVIVSVLLGFLYFILKPEKA